MPKRAIPTLLALILCGATGASSGRAPPHDFRVLDGDTLLLDGAPIRVAGIDAPELGPWAQCWAEAALAGHAKDHLERALHGGSARGDWSLADESPPDSRGRRTARLVGKGGDDIADLMVVAGVAARTAGRWDWCGPDADLHDPLDGEPQPYGPSLWWPTNRMFDERAAD